jgi:hypothetical protein
VRIGFGSDRSGFKGKERLRARFVAQGHAAEEVSAGDFGQSVATTCPTIWLRPSTPPIRARRAGLFERLNKRRTHSAYEIYIERGGATVVR